MVSGGQVEMPKPDEPVKEVRCYKTGKPLPKVPQWLATVNVKFVSDEVRQKEPSPNLLDSPSPFLSRLAPVLDEEDVLPHGEPLEDVGDLDDIAPEELVGDDLDKEAAEIEGDLDAGVDLEEPETPL